MKIICLIRSSPPLIYFANKINSEHQITEVIIEKPKVLSRNIFSKVKKLGFHGIYNILTRKLLQKKNETVDYNAWFANKWEALDKQIPCLEVDNINSYIVLNRVKEIKPDLIIDHGTSIVKDHILQNSGLALNLHWGLSPYYRGTHCTDWALINWDPYNIGVTIHKLTKDIDGGSVLAQRRAKIKSNDTVHSINMQLTHLGTELILEVIDKLNNSEHLNFKKQDYSLGYLTYHRQWNPLLHKQIQYIERNNLIDIMLKKPSRYKKLPIIEMK